LNRLVLPAILAIAFSASGAEPEQGQLDASQTLFTVMAAIHGAGYAADLSSPTNNPLRDLVRAEVLRKNPPSLKELQEFFAAHRKRGLDSDTPELSQYISYALTVKGPPDFGFAMRDVEIPPDVVPLRGLSSLLAAFYKEMDIPALWKRSQPAINEAIARYHAPVADAVFQVNSYLRVPSSGIRNRRFQVLIELVAAPNQVQTRSYGNDFTIVVTPSPEPRSFDIRHAYLHYVLDPLATRNQEILNRKKAIEDHALRSQALDASFKEDFLLLVTECLIKAVEARLDHQPAGVDKALRQGFVLTPYFFEQLAVYEKDVQSMALYYLDMVQAIDLQAEDARLSKVEYDKSAPVGAVVRRPTLAGPPPPTGARKTLADADKVFAIGARDNIEGNVERAGALYRAALDQTSEKPLQAWAYFGLARISLFKNEPDAAEQLFHKALDLDPAAQEKSWTLVYLGRLSLAAGEREKAGGFFKQVLEVAGAPETARKAASEELQQSSKQQE
jgi:tetratricopeptide (TPR) repeat protein